MPSLSWPRNALSRAVAGVRPVVEASAGEGFLRFRAGSDGLNLVAAAGLAFLYNGPFWGEIFRLRADLTLHNLLFYVSQLVLLVATFNLLLSLPAYRFVQKPFLVLILMGSAVASYYVGSYGVLIDTTMIRNVAGTDTREVADLLTPKLFLWVLVLGVLPSALVLRTRIVYGGWLRVLRRRLFVSLASLAAMIAAVAPFYADYASIFPQERHLRHMIVPTNFVYSTVKVVFESFSDGKIVVQPLGEDARIQPIEPPPSRKQLVILVVGETARAQQFSLNGYGRETNPALRAAQVFNFEKVSSCGTSTVVSLPCMFSNQSRVNFDAGKAERTQGLLDVAAHAGVSVFWRENNSGRCKGVCDRVETLQPEDLQDPEFCEGRDCFDEVLLKGLDDQLASAGDHVLVVLHQQGSHGPAYYKRYPGAFRRFTPTCDKSQLQDCTEEEIVNTYDNTILYTDYFLGRVIAFLRDRSERYDGAMLYVSDHGESLGEQNVYLHGLPYFMAPETQTDVPMVVWLSDGFRGTYGVDAGCLEGRHAEPLSHDNLFHSVLGLLNVRSGVYDPGLDLFAGCRVSGHGQPAR